MIEVDNVTRRYGDTVAVDRLSFLVRRGAVTGFLGPNGAGKTTTMRMILGLDAPDSGHVTVNGRRYRDLPSPMREVGALLDAKAIQGGRSARDHLRWLARAGGIPQHRVAAVLEIVGLSGVAGRQLGGFSLGMYQRLGIATALLGDPQVLLLDEPVNGLDPEGIRWLRSLLKELAAEGRTVLLSSHLMSEMEATADHVIVIGRGRLIADASIEAFTRQSVAALVRVVSPDAERFVPLLRQAGARVTAADGVLTVQGLEAACVGKLAGQHRVELHELAPERTSLETAYMALTGDSIDYRAAEGSGAATENVPGTLLEALR